MAEYWVNNCVRQEHRNVDLCVICLENLQRMLWKIYQQERLSACLDRNTQGSQVQICVASDAVLLPQRVQAGEADPKHRPSAIYARNSI